MKSLKIAILALLVATPFAVMAAIYQEIPMLENLVDRWSEFDNNQKIVALDEAIFSTSGDTRSHLEQAKADLPNALTHIKQALKQSLDTMLEKKGFGKLGAVYQKALLESLKQRFEQGLTPQEKIAAIQEALIYATYGTKNALEKAKLDLDNASTIIQEEIDKYNG